MKTTAIAAAVATIMIGYCGKKEFEHDHLYGSGLTWTPEDIHAVPVGIARKLLQHPDVYYDATDMVADAGLEGAGSNTAPTGLEGKDPAANIVDANKPKEGEEDGNKPKDDEDLTARAPLVPLDTMTKADLFQYAQRHFGVELPGNLPKAELVEKVRFMMKQQENTQG
jgi:hypothetical protein